MERRLLWVGLGLLLVVIGVAVFTSFQQAATYRGVLIDPPWEAPEIALTDMNGQPFRLSSLRGQVVLLFFGYTNCPDVCPLTMANLRQVRIDLGDQADRVRVVFVTTDPANDVPDKLKGYVTNFDPTNVGLAGTLPELQQAWKDYGVAVEDGGATHSARVYLIDWDGYLRLTYPSEMTSADLVADIRALLREQR